MLACAGHLFIFQYVMKKFSDIKMGQLPGKKKIFLSKEDENKLPWPKK